MDVRQRSPFYWQKQWPLYNIIYHPGAFVQHPVSYGGYQPVRGWHSIWQASADAKWQWHKEGAHYAGPDRAVFHKEEAWLDLKAQPKIRLQHRSWHLFGLVLMFVISLDRKQFFFFLNRCDCWMSDLYVLWSSRWFLCLCVAWKIIFIKCLCVYLGFQIKMSFQLWRILFLVCLEFWNRTINLTRFHYHLSNI